MNTDPPSDEDPWNRLSAKARREIQALIERRRSILRALS